MPDPDYLARNVAMRGGLEGARALLKAARALDIGPALPWATEEEAPVIVS